jgi:hypothetical protein
MRCDHSGCPLEPARGPRVIVPSKTWLEPGHKPLRMMTTLHYCELHKGDLQVGDFLTAKIRKRFEDTARIIRPIDFKCDFESAFIEFVLVTTPEYRQFMQDLGLYPKVFSV